MSDAGTTQTTGPGGLTLGETLGLVFVAGPLLTGLTLAATSARAQLLAWLLEVGILVGSPLLTIPGLSGAGLDLPRILMAAGVAGLALTAATAAVQRRTNNPTQPR